MKTTTTFFIAFRALLRNPTRACLTMLGIIIGIAAVIALMEIGQGSAGAIRQTIENMGASSILVIPGAAQTSGVSMGSGSGMTLKPSDCEYILDHCPNIVNAAPMVTARGQQAIVGNRNWVPSTLVGSSPAIFAIRKWNLSEGEYFTEQDVRNSASVCVIGTTIVRELFEGESPLGQKIRIKNTMFTVIGVLETKGANMMGFDQDDFIATPWTTMRQRVAGSRTSTGSTSTPEITTNTTYPGGTVSLYPEASSTQRTNYRLSPRFVYVDQLLLEASSPENSAIAEEEIIAALRESHRLKPGEPNDFRIRNAAEMMQTLTKTTVLMANLLLCVALISLVVGGVGIMNIMLVSVTERTREIGLRMAVGARSVDILKQFLIEAVVLCLAGGIMGILLGHGAALMVEYHLKWPIKASPEAVVAAVAVSALVGMVFGFYPAWKASRLDPIEALRYE